jgi:hypothetical protein
MFFQCKFYVEGQKSLDKLRALLTERDFRALSPQSYTADGRLTHNGEVAYYMVSCFTPRLAERVIKALDKIAEG